MRYLFLIIALFLCIKLIFSQNIFNYKIKEEFDQYNNYKINHLSYKDLNNNVITTKYCLIPNIYDQNVFGDQLSKILESYVTMFKITKDKAYLYKFVLQSLCIMRNRHDFSGVNNEPRWSDKNYHDSYIVAAFSKFIYLIKIEYPSLFNESIYPFDEINPSNYLPNSCNCNIFGISFNTFGQYAEWLENRCGETLWWFINNGYWNNQKGVKKNNYPNSEINEVNQQIGFARAFLYVGLSALEPQFLLNSFIIASNFKKPISFYDRCNNRVFFNNQMFILNSNNSYWWYHAGWSLHERQCQTYFNEPDFNAYTEYIEDISHGEIVTWFPIEFYELFPNLYFTSTDMVRLRNMFVNHIYDGNGGFYNNTKGTDVKIFYNNSCSPNNCPHNFHEERSFGYVKLSKFDNYVGVTGILNPYQILINYYYNNKTGANTLPNGYDGQTNKGHAELVEAQWQRECTNLNLFNRDVVYNQDFFAKNNLTISPKEFSYLNKQNDPPYAEPKTFIDNGNVNRFVVEPTINSTFEAANSITIKSGTHFKKGSNVHLNINPNLCSSGNLRVNSNNSIINNKTIDSLVSIVSKITNNSNDLNIESSLIIYPNPSRSGVFNLATYNLSNYNVIIIDIQGKIVYEKNNVNDNNYIIDISTQNKGIYIFKIISNQAVLTEKLVVN
ncbi:MAG: hypothetical protein Kow0079_15020 [Vicingaceae bacterium]